MLKPLRLFIDSPFKILILSALFSLIAIPSECQTVSTFAGNGQQSNEDGTGTAASFSGPQGVAVDAAGNVYVADEINDKIRKITPSGVVSTFAGDGTGGSTDGAGSSASFYWPGAVAVDASGNVYVADAINNKIRKITAAGMVSTLAGTGNYGSTNGTGSSASFNLPSGVAVDASGNVYVADYNNHLIRKVTSSGVVSTFAGSGAIGHADGTGTSASFYYPCGVAADASGNIYVTDSWNHLIRKITPSGVVSTVAGSLTAGNADGTGTAASFHEPLGVAVDASGNLYIADTGNNLIRKITSSGVVSTVAGNGTSGSADGVGTSATFSAPQGIAVNASGDLYIADYNYGLIRKITMVTTGVDESTIASNAFIIYPNPISDQLHIALSEYSVGQVAIYTTEGQAVWSGAFEGTSIIIGTSNLPHGVYILKLTSDKTATSQRITVVR